MADLASGPPPGWYPDPAGGEGWRWWDGSAWTTHTGAAPSPAQPPAAPPLPVDPYTGSPPHPAYLTLHAAPLVDAEGRIAVWARRAVVVVAVGAVIAGSLNVAYSSHLAALFHWYREFWHAARVGGTPPGVPADATLPAVNYLPGLAVLAAEIVFLVWQFRAATAARALGLPARRSPGAGVVFWFVPIVNFWFPYQAICDTLPPGHPARPAVLRFWLAVVAGELLTSTTAVVAAFSEPAAIALLVVTACVWVVAAELGRSVVASVEEAHRTLVGG